MSRIGSPTWVLQIPEEIDDLRETFSVPGGRIISPGNVRIGYLPDPTAASPRACDCDVIKGYFINLDRNRDRRAAIEQNIAAAGASDRYQRFAAVDGQQAKQTHETTLDAGNLGLWLSNEGILQREIDGSSNGHLHILEDDAELAPQSLTLLDEVADAAGDEWDVIWTDITPPIWGGVHEVFKKQLAECRRTGGVELLYLNEIAFSATNSLLIHRKSLKKYQQAIAGGWREGKPIDLFLREAVRRGSLRGFVTIPFLTTVSANSNQSDIRGDFDWPRRVQMVYRRAFFIGADLAAAEREIGELTAQAKVEDPLDRIFIAALAARFSDKWQPF